MRRFHEIKNRCDAEISSPACAATCIILRSPLYLLGGRSFITTGSPRRMGSYETLCFGGQKVENLQNGKPVKSTKLW